jgi:hypothetical protein
MINKFILISTGNQRKNVKSTPCYKLRLEKYISIFVIFELLCSIEEKTNCNLCHCRHKDKK